MKYKAVYADVDGTLIPPSANPSTKASSRLQHVVSLAKQRGVAFGLSTARSLDWVSGLVESLSVDDPIILDNGARIYEGKTGKYLVNNFLSNEVLQFVLDHLRHFNQEIVIVDTKNRFIYDPTKRYTFGNVIKCIVLHINPTLAQTIYESVKKLGTVAVTKSVSRTNPIGESIHITHPDARKDKALTFICDYLGISPSEVIGIGDSYNDYEFLKVCGMKVAVQNAIDDIKKIADYVAPSYNDEGVADVIEKFILSV